MKQKWSSLLLVVIFIIGLMVLLYPSVSDYINQIDASHAVTSYEQKMGSITTSETEQIFAAAEAYNRELAQKPPLFINGEVSDPEYQSLLNVTDDGMMGFVTIKRISLQLPIYHGTSDSVLSKTTGHLEGSSFPVGGESTHSVITGHRGLPSAKLFTDLDQLVVGDEFTVSVLNRTLRYTVDKIHIVLPDEVDHLAIEPGKDYVTLVTCTPYAVNTHRLLVRGVRTDTVQERLVSTDAVQIEPELVAPVVAAPILMVLFLLVILKPTKRHALKKEKAGEDNE